MLTLHALSRERLRVRCVLLSHFTWKRSAGARASAGKSWFVMDMLMPENRTPRTDGIPVEDAGAQAQAHRRGGPRPCSVVQWCRSPPPQTCLTPHMSPCLSRVLPSREAGRRLAVGDERLIPFIASALCALAAPARSDPPFPMYRPDPALFRSQLAWPLLAAVAGPLAVHTLSRCVGGAHARAICRLRRRLRRCGEDARFAGCGLWVCEASPERSRAASLRRVRRRKR